MRGQGPTWLGKNTRLLLAAVWALSGLVALVLVITFEPGPRSSTSFGSLAALYEQGDYTTFQNETIGAIQYVSVEDTKKLLRLILLDPQNGLSEGFVEKSLDLFLTRGLKDKRELLIIAHGFNKLRKWDKTIDIFHQNRLPPDLVLAEAQLHQKNGHNFSTSLSTIISAMPGSNIDKMNTHTLGLGLANLLNEPGFLTLGSSMSAILGSMAKAQELWPKPDNDSLEFIPGYMSLVASNFDSADELLITLDTGSDIGVNLAIALSHARVGSIFKAMEILIGIMSDETAPWTYRKAAWNSSRWLLNNDHINSTLPLHSMFTMALEYFHEIFDTGPSLDTLNHEATISALQNLLDQGTLSIEEWALLSWHQTLGRDLEGLLWTTANPPSPKGNWFDFFKGFTAILQNDEGRAEELFRRAGLRGIPEGFINSSFLARRHGRVSQAEEDYANYVKSISLVPTKRNQ